MREHYRLVPVLIGACLVTLATIPLIASSGTGDDIAVLLIEKRSNCDQPEWTTSVANRSSDTYYRLEVVTSVQGSAGPAGLCTEHIDEIVELDPEGCSDFTNPFFNGDVCSGDHSRECANDSDCMAAGECLGGVCTGNSSLSCANDSDCMAAGECLSRPCDDPCCIAGGNDCDLCTSFTAASVTIVATKTDPGDWQSVSIPVCGSNDPGVDDCPTVNLCDDGVANTPLFACGCSAVCESRTPHCLTSTCVECLADSHCTHPMKPTCHLNQCGPDICNGTQCPANEPICIEDVCVECEDDNQCKSPEPRCNTTTNECVHCLTRADCGGAACINNFCLSHRR